MSKRPTLAEWRERALAAERALDLAASSPPVRETQRPQPAAPGTAGIDTRRPPVSATGPREDIASGNVWPDAEDPEYVDWLAQRVRDLEVTLARCEALLARYEEWGDRALAGIDAVVARLIVEEHGPPPPPWRHDRHEAP